MIPCDLKDLYKTKYVALWTLLSFKAGYLNAAGFLATGKFVSHVTGFGTQAGISLAHEDYAFGIELLIIPIAFIFGSSVPAWVLERKYDEKTIPPYPIVQGMITFLLLALAILGITGWLGTFATREDDLHDILLIGVLCLVCGMKNGLTTWATFGKIRTTHVTGLSTDIGLNLPKFFRKSKSRFPEEIRVNQVRIATLLSFSTGSLISAFVIPRTEYYGFLLPAVLSVGIFVISLVSYRRLSKSVQEVPVVPLRMVREQGSK